MNCRKGLDRSFLHYGIREDDLRVIRELCGTHEIPEEWLVDQVLKSYHEAKVRDIELGQEAVEQVIEKALERGDTLEEWLAHVPKGGGNGGARIPALRLAVGDYGEDGMAAELDLSSRAVTNTQILVAGATGSGKTNLLAVLSQLTRNNLFAKEDALDPVDEAHYMLDFDNRPLRNLIAVGGTRG